MRSSKKNVLLAIPSYQDPEVLGHKRELGPILKLLQEHDFDEVILMGLQKWKLNAFLTERSIQASFPKITVKKQILPVNDVSNYKDVFYPLKQALSQYEYYLRTECNEPFILLPPAICECLLDSWLLLVTSLNMKIRICQVESHYSVEGVYSQAPEEQNLDWLAEYGADFHDPIAEISPNKERWVLTETQIAFLDKLCQTNRSFFINTEHHTYYADALTNYFARYAQNRSAHYMKVGCSEIPEEILNPVLWGYEQNTWEGQRLQRKGLLQKFTNGWIALENYDRFPFDIQKKIQSTTEGSNKLHIVGWGDDPTKCISEVPVYVLP